MSQFEKLVIIDGKRFKQEMDLDDDTAYYRDGRGNLLMKIDSSGYCTDIDGKPCGRFRMNWPAETWRYESEDEKIIIDTPHKLLFDNAEPMVIAKLFADKL